MALKRRPLQKSVRLLKRVVALRVAQQTGCLTQLPSLSQPHLLSASSPPAWLLPLGERVWPGAVPEADQPSLEPVVPPTLCVLDEVPRPRQGIFDLQPLPECPGNTVRRWGTGGRDPWRKRPQGGGREQAARFLPLVLPVACPQHGFSMQPAWRWLEPVCSSLAWNLVGVPASRLPSSLCVLTVMPCDCFFPRSIAPPWLCLPGNRDQATFSLRFSLQLHTENCNPAAHPPSFFPTAPIILSNVALFISYSSS